MPNQLDLLLQMIDEAPGRFDAFLAQMHLSPEEAMTLRQGLDEGASSGEAQAAAATLAESIWAFLDADQLEAVARL